MISNLINPTACHEFFFKPSKFVKDEVEKNAVKGFDKKHQVTLLFENDLKKFY